MDEQQIEALAQQLGTRHAATVSAERTANAVVARLAEGDDRVWSTVLALRVLRIAAAVILLVGSVLVIDAARQSASDPANGAAVALEGLGVDELEQVLDSLDAEAPVSEFVAGNLNDLSDGELVELLAIMEG